MEVKEGEVKVEKTVSWYDDQYILTIIVTILLILLVIGIVIYFSWDNFVKVDYDDGLVVNLYKSSPDSVFIYADIKLPDELKVYKPRPSGVNNLKQMPRLYDYLRVIEVTQRTKYTFEMTKLEDQTTQAEFIIYKFPTNEIAHSTPQPISEIYLDPGLYNVLLVTLSDEDIIAKYYPGDYNGNVPQQEMFNQQPTDQTKEVIDKMTEKGYTLDQTYEYNPQLNQHIPNFYKYESPEIEVNKEDIIVILLQGNQHKNYITITKDNEDITGSSLNYINSIEIMENGKIKLKAHSHTTQTPQTLKILIFS